MSDLKRIRIERFQLSQAAMAAVIGTTQSRISRCEAGERQLTHSELAALLKYARRRRINVTAEQIVEAGE